MADKYTIEAEKIDGDWRVRSGDLKGIGHTLWQALSVLCGRIREQEIEEAKNG